MSITILYETLLKRAAGTASDVVNVDRTCSVKEAIRQIARLKGDPVESLLLDASGAVRPSVLIFVGDRQVSASDLHTLRDGDVVTLMSPISGG
ncbi:MAG: MoaD/ThiS family protein [Planctomycetaceae bacterium]